MKKFIEIFPDDTVSLIEEYIYIFFPSKINKWIQFWCSNPFTGTSLFIATITDIHIFSNENGENSIG